MDEKGYAPCPTLEIYDMPVKKIIYAASVGLDADVFNAFLQPEPEVAEEEADSLEVAKE